MKNNKSSNNVLKKWPITISRKMLNKLRSMTNVFTVTERRINNGIKIYTIKEIETGKSFDCIIHPAMGKYENKKGS